MVDLLREREATKLSAFFGETVVVPRAPQLLWKTLETLKSKRITIFSPHYLPAKKFEEKSEYPGWHTRPQEWFWEQIEEGELSADSANLPGVWVLVDHSVLQRDPFGNILGKLFERRYRKSEFPTLDHWDPRLNISAHDLDRMVFPALRSRFELEGDKVEVRSPRAIEFNFLGNLHHPEFANSPHSIWLEDPHLSGSRLVSGNANRGGLTGIDWRRPDLRYDVVGFRPMIVFAR